MALAQIEGLFDEILDFLASTPTPEAIIEFQPPRASTKSFESIIGQKPQRSIIHK